MNMMLAFIGQSSFKKVIVLKCSISRYDKVSCYIHQLIKLPNESHQYLLCFIYLRSLQKLEKTTASDINNVPSQWPTPLTKRMLFRPVYAFIKVTHSINVRPVSFSLTNRPMPFGDFVF